MRRLRMGTIGFAVALLLVVPRMAHAGMGEWIDVIVGLTGPQMVGLPIACDFILNPTEANPDAAKKACFAGPLRIKGPRLPDGFWSRRNFWASVGGAVYFSTTKNSEMRPFDWFDAGMLAFEPTLNYRSLRIRNSAGALRFVIEHGAGGSIFYVFGDGFEPFVKGGIKLRPIAFTVTDIFESSWDLGVAYNLRIFPSPFTSAEFGVDSAASTHGGREFAHGFTAIVGWGQ